jgi:hypothetical protein
MSNFSDEQSRKSPLASPERLAMAGRGLRRGVLMYVDEVSPRRTQLIAKRAISGWKLVTRHGYLSKMESI